MTQPLPTNSAGAIFVPDFDFTKTNTASTVVVKLGDGYEHRTTVGLNQNPKVFNLSFKNISEADADILTDFFDLREQDGDSITYQIPTESVSMKFVLQGTYSKKVNYANIATIQVTFRQVFDL